jgi:hypothetical protein
LSGLGVIVIATGNYINFLPNFIKSCRLNLNYPGDVNFYIFTDKNNLNNFGGESMKFFEYNFLEWPMPTLMRYEGILSQKEILSQENHLIYIDVDMKVNSSCSELFNYELFAVRHPRHKISKKNPFERNLNSMAYIDDRRYSTYVCGGVQGGKSETYLKAIQNVNVKIHEDLKNSLIAKWHDESYWNKYVYENVGIKIFPSEYCWPEQWVTTNTPGRIIALRKNHSAVRNDFNPGSKLRFLLSDARMRLLRPRTY